MTDLNEVKMKVVAFGQEMIKKFTHHKDKPGWEDLNTIEDIHEFLTCLRQEVEELEQAILYESDDDVVKEAADVANYCLIISDLIRRTERKW